MADRAAQHNHPDVGGALRDFTEDDSLADTLERLFQQLVGITEFTKPPGARTKPALKRTGRIKVSTDSQRCVNPKRQINRDHDADADHQQGGD